MKKQTPDKWAGLAELTKRFRGDKVPDTAFTTYEYAARFGLGHEAARRQLDNLAGEGAVKIGKKRMVIGGQNRLVRVYWMPEA